MFLAEKRPHRWEASWLGGVVVRASNMSVNQQVASSIPGRALLG